MEGLEGDGQLGRNTSSEEITGTAVPLRLRAAYYFMPRFEIFAEAGFDRYNLQV
jgi:hypothetical protein